MSLSRQEVNLRRALAKCELMLKSNKEDARLKKLVVSLEEMLLEVKKTESYSSYENRIQSIKVALGLMTFKETNESMREDLLGVRKRNVKQTDNLDELINFHEEKQQEITSQILSFTTSLKEQSQLANKIIKKDTEVVSQSAQLTDQNYSRLTVETAKLAEHSKRACKCWMWVMLVVVLLVFVNMVIFMKVMKKK